MYFPNTITTTLLALLSTTATALPQTVSTNPPGSSGGNTIGEWTFTVQQHKDMANNCTVENATAIYYGEMAPYGLTSTCWHVIPMAGNGVSRGTHNCTNRFSYQIGGVHARPGQSEFFFHFFISFFLGFFLSFFLGFVWCGMRSRKLMNGRPHASAAIRSLQQVWGYHVQGLVQHDAVHDRLFGSSVRGVAQGAYFAIDRSLCMDHGS